MKKRATILLFTLIFPLLAAAQEPLANIKDRVMERPPAPAGFQWKEYPDVYCALQVPNGWHERPSSAGLTKIIFISPDRIEGTGIDTGLTMQAVHCKTNADWKEAMSRCGKLMGDARDAIENPIISKIDKSEDMLFMIVDGVRKIPGGAKPDKLFRVRNIVRAFPKYRIVYVYSFGAPAEDWDLAWKKGEVMLKAIDFSIPQPE